MRAVFSQKCFRLKANETLTEIVVVPDGVVELAGMEPIELDDESAKVVIQSFEDQGVDIPVDYEHSSVEAGEKGLPAPAVAWIDGLRYEKGKGLLGTVHEWTADAKKQVEDKGYKYVSPVLLIDKNTRKPYRLHSVALTNKPRIKHAPELLAASEKLAARYGDDDRIELAEELMDAVKQMAEALRGYGLDVPDGAPAGAVLSAAMTYMSAQRQLASHATMLAEKLSCKPDEVVVAVEKLRGHVGFVPAEEHKAVLGRLEALEGESKTKRVSDAVALALSENKLNPNNESQMKWAREFAARDLEGFAVIMKDAPSYAAPGRTTAGGPVGDSRDHVIARAGKEWDGSATVRRMNDKFAWVNGELREAGLTLLSETEKTKL